MSISTSINVIPSALTLPIVATSAPNDTRPSHGLPSSPASAELFSPLARLANSSSSLQRSVSNSSTRRASLPARPPSADSSTAGIELRELSLPRTTEPESTNPQHAPDASEIEPAYAHSDPPASAPPTSETPAVAQHAAVLSNGAADGGTAHLENAAGRPQAQTPTVMQRLQTSIRDTGSRFQPTVPHIAPGVDAIAAIFSLVAGGLTKQDTAAEALKVTSVTCGAAWATSAIASELNNLLSSSPHNRLVSAANFLGTLAGVLSIAGPLAAPNESAGIGYAAASSWVGNAVATAAAAARLKDTFAKVLQGGSAVANGAAGGLAELATKASAEGNTQHAAMYTIASAALWLAGSAAAEGAVLRDNHINSLANRPGGPSDSPV
jgi:hypothetical protein